MNLVGHEIKFEDNYITDVFYVYNKPVDKLKDPNYDIKVVHFLKSYHINDRFSFPF